MVREFLLQSLVVILRGTGRLDCQVMDDQGFTPAMLLDSDSLIEIAISTEPVPAGGIFDYICSMFFP